MAIETQTVIIEFIADTTHIQKTIDILEKLGAVDAKMAGEFRKASAEINKQATAMKAGVAAGLEDISKASKKLNQEFVKGFQEGIIDTLKDAGVSVDEFADRLTNSGGTVQKSTKSVRAEIRALTEQIARMKVAGQDQGKEFDALVYKAGKLKDALQDANFEAKNVGSDTSNIDGMISLATGAAGAFSVAQGAIALFGEESEDLQKTLIKVNATLSILQGLQAVATMRLRESAAMRLIDKIQTNGQIAAQRTYAIVVGQSTGALKAFRIALAATGIGALIMAIGYLAANWNEVKDAISGVSKEQKDLVENSKESAEAEEAKLEHLNGQDSVLKLQGKTEREILQLKIDQTDEVITYREQQLKAQQEMLKSQIDAEARNKRILAGMINFITFPLNGIIKVINAAADFFGKDLDLPTTGELASLVFDEKATKEKGVKAQQELKNHLDRLKDERASHVLQIREIDKAAAAQRLKDAIATTEAQLLNAESGSERELALQKQLLSQQANEAVVAAKSAAERKLIQEQLHRDLQQADADHQKFHLSVRTKTIEAELAAVESGSHRELQLRQELLALQAEAELTNSRLTAEQRDSIMRESHARQVELGKVYVAQLQDQAIKDAISLNNAEMALLETTAQRRLNLQIQNIELASRQEITAAKGNAARIKEIEAARLASIRDLRLKHHQETTEKQVAAEEKRQSRTRQVLESMVNDERLSAHDRIDAINGIKDQDEAILDLRLKALRIAHAKMLITEEEFQDQWTDIFKKKNGIEEESAAKTESIMKDSTARWVEIAFSGLEQLMSVFESLASLQSEKDQQRIEGMRASLEQAEEAGAITEREAVARSKRIDADERRFKAQAAQRDKQLAIFNAIINTARAVTAALALPPPFGQIQAAIVGAMGAAQIAIIASRPIPKFRSGKKNSYEGLGEVGEAGTEIIQKENRLYVVDKPTITWLAKKDIVYNPAETKELLSNRLPWKMPNFSTPYLNHELMSRSVTPELASRELAAATKEIKAMHKTIAKLPITNVTLDEDGFKVFTQTGNSRINYFNQRYSYR